MEPSSESESESQKSNEGPQALWRLMSSSLLTLFDDLSKAGDDLLSFMNSILNSKQLFSASLVPSLVATPELTNQYECFNKWLLGRLFYILSIEKLKRIHDVSLKAQIKILSILYYNNSIFYSDICNDYIDTCGNLLDYLKSDENSEQPKILQLKMLVPNISHIKNTDINLIPLFVNVSSTKICENLIAYLLDISCHIMTSSYDMHKNIHMNKIVFQNLFVLENLSLDFKLSSINFFIKIFEKYGFCIEPRLTNDFFLLIENLVLNTGALLNEGSLCSYKQMSRINRELNYLMVVVKVHIKSFDEPNSSVILNICKFILNSEDSSTNSHENNSKDNFLEIPRNTFDSSLKMKCAKILEFLPCDEVLLTEDVTKLRYYVKNAPMQFVTYILSQLKMSVYTKSHSQIVVDLMEKSPIVQKLISILTISLESALCDDIHLFVIKEHLETCLNILNIILSVNISFYSIYQQHCGLHEFIFDLKHENVSKRNLFDQNLYLKCIFRDQTKCIVKNIKEVLKIILKNKSNSMEEIYMCGDICMKILLLTEDFYYDDFLSIIQMECFAISKSHEFTEKISFSKEIYFKCHQEYHAKSLNILMVQSFFLNGPLDNEGMKKKVSEILSICDISDDKVHSEILKCCPLLILNDIKSPSQCIENYFLPIFLSKKENLYADLLNVLSNVVHILYGHFCVLQSALGDDCDENMFSCNGVQLSIVCFHCLHSNNDSNHKIQIQNNLKRNKNMINLRKSKFSYNSVNDTTAELKKLFDNVSNFNFLKKVPKKIFCKFIQTILEHSVISPCIIGNIFTKENLSEMQEMIKPFFSIVLNNTQLDDTVKKNVLNSFVNLLLGIIKKSLEDSHVGEQDYCLEIIRKFGMSKSKDVLLTSMKLLLFFLMHYDCPLGNKATLYLKDICESHALSPNSAYHMYKKDLCRMIIDLTSFNYLAEKEFIPSVRKVVIAFEFASYRDYISKEIHHVLPYLVPKVVQIENLQNIIIEISKLIPCTPAELLTDRFAHIYTHIYIIESESVATKCYQYIEVNTGISLSKLIKKHARLILTELLIQYCSSPERVIKACKQLRNIDMDSKGSQTSAISLTQVADYIQPKMLGVLANIDNKLIHTRIALSVKRKVFQSFPHIINLMGSKYITILRFKILATLRTSLSSMKDFPLLNIEAWNAFVRNVDTTSLGPLLTTIVVSLLPLMDSIPEKLNEILEYLIVQNENILSTHISDLFFLEKTSVSNNIKKIVCRHVLNNQPKLFVDKIQWYMQYLNHDTLEVKVYALKYLFDSIKTGRHELDTLIFNSKNTNMLISDLLEILMIGCKSKDSNFSEWSSRCIGQFGALHPSLLPCELSLLKTESQFSFTFMNVSFVKTALIELASSCQFEKDTKLMDCYSLAIQDMLNMFKITPDGENKDVWESFPENLHQIMIPLLTSRYVLAYPIMPLNAHPVYGSSYASTFSEWGYNWTGKLIMQINQDNVNKIFQAIHPALKKERTLVIFLPYIILHAILTNEEDIFIKEEIMKIIALESFHNESSNSNNLLKIMRCPNLVPAKSPVILEEGTHIKCCKIIYNLFDFLNRWLMEWCYISKKSIENSSYLKINTFLKKFCKLTIARGNFLSGELERALQYLELYMEESPEQFQEQLGFLAEIYAVLNESDSVSGIMRLKENEPSLLESILAHEVTGHLQDAATCYEKYAQQGNIENDKIQGMVNVYLGLDQPFTALNLLHGIEDTEIEAFNAEPFWRLGMFDELDRLLERPDVAQSDSWGVTVGHCLLALRKGVRDDVHEKLNLARCALLRKLDRGSSYMSAEESVYSRAYFTAFSLHMLSEIEQVEDFIFKIKDLQDGDESCAAIINNLNVEWSLRLKFLQSSTSTFEPVLRLRRILLEQSKELLKNSHPGILSLLDAQIGKLWLHSAKFARKSGTYQQAYIYILNGEKYAPKELFIEKAKLYWMRNQQEQAFCTLKRGFDEHFSGKQTTSAADKKLSAKAKLLIAIYNDETSNVDMDVNISYYQDAVLANREWEKSLVFLAEYHEKVYTALSESEKKGSIGCNARLRALEYYGRSLQHGHKRLYQSMPRMLTIWLDFGITAENKQVSVNTLTQMCSMIEAFTERLPLYLFLTAFSQIVSRICHPVNEVYVQLKSIIVKLILAYQQHSIWMMMCVINSSYQQRIKRCRDILNDPRLSDPAIQKFITDFKLFAEKLISLCNNPISGNNQTTNVSAIVKDLPRIFQMQNFSQIMMPHEKFVKLSLPFTVSNENNSDPFPSLVYVSGIEEHVTILPSLQKPRKVTLKGSDGKKYIIMLKPNDDLRKDFRLMEFNAVVNRYLQDNPEARERRLHIRTYTVLPLNEKCGLIEWIPNLLGLRLILLNIYKTKGIFVQSSKLKALMCKSSDPLALKRKVFETQLLPSHPPVFSEWFRYTFLDPHSWFQARTAYIRTTAVMSMVGYILGLGDRHGENILYDSTNGDTVHVDFNCLFNKGEDWEYPETVPFRFTHNMQCAMGPLRHEGIFRKCCEITMHVLRAQTSALMAVIRPFVYDPLVSWQKDSTRDIGERINNSAKENLSQIESRLQGTVRTRGKQCTLSLSPEGQTNALIQEAMSVVNLCQMYIGWGPFY